MIFPLMWLLLAVASLNATTYALWADRSGLPDVTIECPNDWETLPDRNWNFYFVYPALEGRHFGLYLFEDKDFDCRNLEGLEEGVDNVCRPLFSMRRETTSYTEENRSICRLIGSDDSFIDTFCQFLLIKEGAIVFVFFNSSRESFEQAWQDSLLFSESVRIYSPSRLERNESQNSGRPL